ncbi:Mediator of RNA polymerase II transcription subunit 23, partial [Clarias magur]
YGFLSAVIGESIKVFLFIRSSWLSQRHSDVSWLRNIKIAFPFEPFYGPI